MSTADGLTAFFVVISLALLGAVVALLAQVLRQQGRLLLRLDALEASFSGTAAPAVTAATKAATRSGLPIGSKAPDFRLAAYDGSVVTLENLTSGGRPVLLLFTNPNCGPCVALAPEIDVWQAEHHQVLSIVRVSEGTAEESGGHGQALLQIQREVADAYQCWGTPGAVLVRPDGTVGSWVAQGAEAIRSLVTRNVHVTQQHHHGTGKAAGIRRRSGISIGSKPPAMALQDQNARTIVLDDFVGRDVMLLFWNPECGFCQHMLDDLRAWDAAPPSDAPALIVVSAAPGESNRDMGLASPVVSDERARIRAAFGAHGTPMAVLLDAEGRVASDVVAGADAVMNLANPSSRIREKFVASA